MASFKIFFRKNFQVANFQPLGKKEGTDVGNSQTFLTKMKWFLHNLRFWPNIGIFQNSKYFWEKKLQVASFKLPFFGRKRERNQKRTVYKMWIGRQEWINTDFDRSNWVWMCKCGCWWARGPFFLNSFERNAKKGLILIINHNLASSAFDQF